MMTQRIVTTSDDSRRGFTLVELLVVIGIIALLISILLPSLNAARQQSIKVKCLSQMKQFGNGFVMYVNENKGWMPSSDTNGPLYPNNFLDVTQNAIFPTSNQNQTWIGWVDGGPSTTALQNGTLWKYIKNAAVYKCPADFNQYRSRTYSMNGFLAPGNTDMYLTTTQFRVFKVTQVRDATNTIAFSEEGDPRASGTAASANTMLNQWNLGGWYETPAVLAAPGSSLANTWGDTVVSWHHGGCNFAFVDGHAEYWRWSDARTVNFLKNDPNWPNTPYVTPNNPDLAKVQRDICTWTQQH